MERTYKEMMVEALEAAKAAVTEQGSKWHLRYEVSKVLEAHLKDELGKDYDVDSGRDADNVAAKSMRVQHIASGAVAVLWYNLRCKQDPTKSWSQEFTIRDLVISNDEGHQATLSMTPSAHVQQFIQSDLKDKQRTAARLEEHTAALKETLEAALAAIANGEPVALDRYTIRNKVDNYNDAVKAAYVVAHAEQTEGGK